MTPAAFVGQALDKSFPGVRALSGVNLRLEAGSIHALLGENGAGKSTLIKIMTGVHRPDGGQMTLRGEPADFHRPLDAARAGIGAVHQERNLVPAFSVGENIMLQDLPSLRGGRVDRARIRARARECLDELGIELDGVTTASGHRGVSLSVRAGEIVGLYGLVGAGRSELAKAVLGLDRITSGAVRVRGQRARIRDVGDALRRCRIGYVTENRKEEGLFLDQTVARNVAVTVWDRLRTRFGPVPGRAESELAQRHVDQLDIRVSSVRQAAGQLSGGNQQKVSLAKWLAAQTEILIVDEPTVGIDVRTKAAFHQAVIRLIHQPAASVEAA